MKTIEIPLNLYYTMLLITQDIVSGEAVELSDFVKLNSGLKSIFRKAPADVLSGF